MHRRTLIGPRCDTVWAMSSRVIGLAAMACFLLSAANALDPFTPQQRRYWAFQPVTRPAVPAAGATWTRNPVDAFIARKLPAKRISLGPEASRTELIRRASLDLTGLPPSPDQVAAFIADRSPRAYEAVVEALLASPHYGERWGRHWLDVARYAESTGFEDDVTRPNIWRYRDYVIASFNADKPYDRFIREQIAGDELWPADPQARIATAFNRHYPEEGNNKDLLLARQEMLHGITSATGAAILGLTFECARCHNHKFDPILQKDYYQLQAFFANVDHDDRFSLATAGEQRRYEEQLAQWDAQTQPIWDEMSELLMPHRTFTPAQLLERYPDYVVEAIKTLVAARTPMQVWMAHLLATKTCGNCPLRPKPYLDPGFKGVVSKLKGAGKQRYEQLEAELAKHAHLKPKDLPRGSAVVEVGPRAPATHVLGVGLYTAPQEEVQPAFPTILASQAPAITPQPGSTGRRTALAHWLADPANPLPARVMVNRVWHHHFGTGIVASPGDFGVIGGRPSHPELLDWLTSEFVREGWSLKKLHRLIMTSATYRQSSAPRATAREADPSNRLLWRFPPRRLEAAAIRDSALAVAGALSPQTGGPSVFPPLPAGTPKLVGGWDLSKAAADQQRRSVYIFVRRNDPYPMLNAIDFPDTHESCSRRNQTTTAPQALTLLNSSLTADWSRQFATRVERAAGSDRSRQ
ncbi:MAG: DUF1553 domain-containing protein, partial [Acidobacteria bacterium]|nr:DUF1553 domain-containing protein [Acidobacteriota bacterium]